jgi:glycosyltransferase involved in cell wall biosynthesis
MRICYLCSDSGVKLSKYNGSANHVRSLVGSFVELGHDVDLVMTRTEGAEELGVRVRDIPRAAFPRSLSGLARASGRRVGDGAPTTALLRALRRIWADPLLEEVLSEELTRNRPDLVYERHSPYSVAGAVVARRLGLPHLLEVNAPLAWEGARHRGQALNDAADLLESLAFEATSRILTVSAELRELLVTGGVDAARIHVVPNGVDPGRFGDDGPRLPSGLEGKLVLGFVGSLKAWHGVEVLAEAFTMLAGDARFHLLAVGDGPMSGVLHELEERLPGRVSLEGAVHPSEVPAYLRTIDVALAPYPRLDRFYFSPLKVLEYMASATPVVASRIGQLEELIRDGESGLLVEPGDPQALADAVRRLAADPDLRGRLGRRASAEVVASHSWKRRAREILDLATAES